MITAGNITVIYGKGNRRLAQSPLLRYRNRPKAAEFFRRRAKKFFRGASAAAGDATALALASRHRLYKARCLAAPGRFAQESANRTQRGFERTLNV